MTSIAKAAHDALCANVVTDKVNLTHSASKAWFKGELSNEFDHSAPKRPGRPEKPELLSPHSMPKRRKAKSNAGRVAMLHAICHIELNAIDLAWDIVLRFGEDMPKIFIDDWVKVADDEARHFSLLENRLKELDSFYGALPAHDGLWQSAETTAHDLLARLAIVPLVLEARGLDVTPTLIEKFKSAGDKKSVDALNIIYQEEIDHVRAGNRWFLYLCEKKSLNPQSKYQELVNKYFTGSLKPPFNTKARNEAGFDESFYLPLVKKLG